MKTCIYLRKSRADEELEKINPGNTLNRHKETLLKVAEEKKLIIVKIHEEIVSGESIGQRPAMLKLLEEVSENMYDAVLVMDMDRLGRGNMQEQGLILDTFKNSNTKIITPRKTYDLNDEFDEEYSEFEAFMARKELKIITRRMQRGRVKSIEEGNYIYTYAPFGYKIVGEGRKRRLEIDEKTGPIVKFIFEQYALGHGGSRIAEKLNNMGYKTATGKKFYNNSVLNMIKNPAYIGKVSWGKRNYTKKDSNGKRIVRARPQEEWPLYDGKHEPLISQELFDACQNQLKNKSHVPYNTKLTNPLAGIIFCSYCGKPMVYRTYVSSPPHLLCSNSNCKQNKSSRFDYIECEVLNTLDNILKELNAPGPYEEESKTDITDSAIQNIKSELTKLYTQKSRLHDLLEQGIYDVDTFISRSESISNRIDKLNASLTELSNQKPKITNQQACDFIRTVLDTYKHSDDVMVKNQLMKNLINKVIYTKEKDAGPTEFKLSIQLNI